MVSCDVDTLALLIIPLCCCGKKLKPFRIRDPTIWVLICRARARALPVAWVDGANMGGRPNYGEAGDLLSNRSPFLLLLFGFIRSASRALL